MFLGMFDQNAKYVHFVTDDPGSFENDFVFVIIKKLPTRNQRSFPIVQPSLVKNNAISKLCRSKFYNRLTDASLDFHRFCTLFESRVQLPMSIVVFSIS